MADQLPSLYEMYMKGTGMDPTTGVGARTGPLGSDVANPSQPQQLYNPGNLNIGGTPANAPLGVGGMPWGPPPQTMSFGMEAPPDVGPPPGIGGSGTSGDGGLNTSAYPPGPSGAETGGLYPDWTGSYGNTTNPITTNPLDGLTSPFDMPSPDVGGGLPVGYPSNATEGMGGLGDFGGVGQQAQPGTQAAPSPYGPRGPMRFQGKGMSLLGS